MGAVVGFSICQLGGTLDASLKAVQPNGNWMGVTIVNGSAQDVTLSTNPDNSGAQVTIPAGESFMIQAVFGPGQGTSYRFAQGVPAFYLSTASGDGTGVYVVWA